MRVVRGRAETVADDRAATADLFEHTAETGEAGLRVWPPAPQVAFGPRDRRAAGYERARERAAERGFEPVDREAGGRALAYAGDTLAVAYTVATDGAAGEVRSRTEGVTNLVLRGLCALGATAWRGDPEGAFAPGDTGIKRDGKFVAINQRVRRDAALVEGCVVVSEADADRLADVLGPVYGALDLPFDRAAVGSVESAGGPDDPAVVAEAIERGFVADREPGVVTL